MNYEHWRHYARGWLLHVFGREHRAFNAYAAAYRAKPDDAKAARHLAHIAASRKQYDIADKWFVETVLLAPKDADAHFNRGFVLEQAGRSREAIAAFAEAARLQPTLDRAWYGIGLAHARLGEQGEAAAAFAKCAELQPMNGEAYYQWAMACHHGNRPDEVARIVRRLAGFEPKRAMELIRDSERADLFDAVPQEVREFLQTRRR